LHANGIGGHLVLRQGKGQGGVKLVEEMATTQHFHAIQAQAGICCCAGCQDHLFGRAINQAQPAPIQQGMDDIRLAIQANVQIAPERISMA